MKSEEEKKRIEEQKILVNAYADTFLSESGKVVLKDLRKEFDGDCFNSDPILMAGANGERRVILRIKSWLILTKNRKKFLEAFAEVEDNEYKP